MDLSKVLMYSFHYDYIKKNYPGEFSKLLFTDTDSLTYKIYTEDIYDDMLKNSQLFDFSGYNPNHKCFSLDNKKVIGKMKDELDGLPMTEFVGLKAKLYSYKTTNKENKRAKGIQKAVVRKNICHKDYKNTVFNHSNKSVDTYAIRSINHQIFTIKQKKKALSSFDDKRFILPDGITTLPHGHKAIRNNLF